MKHNTYADVIAFNTRRTMDDSTYVDTFLDEMEQKSSRDQRQKRLEQRRIHDRYTRRKDYDLDD
ncbi:hypothetical protein UFOVP273_92 [uncultured Caudovirales phage]|uniref:Uncharacterized protein n=1 Tax=uncultured Caudovirales phage TaxID=2100421 RepID=A0A6J5LM98_9CAUD|nr:hypothetical protein UFOVP273_92 [uncultured Caudovirales phage]